jgi:hypothetical protein
MPYVYEGDEPTRVNGVRYAPGSVSESDDVKDKKGFREVSDEEVEKLAADRPGTFGDAKPDAWEEKFAEHSAWVGRASVAAPLNRVIGDNEAPYGPPTGTITTKQAVMREASSSNERNAFGDHEWLPEDEEKLGDSTSSHVQKAQAVESGQVEAVTDELVGDQQDSDGDSSEGSAQQSQEQSQQSRPRTAKDKS